jgi:hypothetical protein
VLHPKRRLEPPALEAPSPAIADFNDTYHYAYSAARLREACQLFARTIASGATPSEAVSWGKIDPGKLPGTVVCYLDSTVALPPIGAYVLARCTPRKPRRLYDRLPQMFDNLQAEYRKTKLYKRYWGRAASKEAPHPEDPRERTHTWHGPRRTTITSSARPRACRRTSSRPTSPSTPATSTS